MSPEFIRGEIADGKLQAEDVMINGRRFLRIHLEAFVVYLQTIGWKRLPRSPRHSE